MTKRGEWDSKESKDRELFGELSVDIEVDESKKQASQLQENAVEDCLQDISATYDDQVQDYQQKRLAIGTCCIIVNGLVVIYIRSKGHCVLTLLLSIYVVRVTAYWCFQQKLKGKELQTTIYVAAYHI